MDLQGRQVIYTDIDDVNDSNVQAILERALPIHLKNQAQIQYLYDYYKGKQPILQRVKEFREDICNKIVENRANEIVSFKVGYLMGEPVQYVNRGGEENLDAINILNNYMFAEDKAEKDKELADWFTICGTAYRMALPDTFGEEDEAPFEIYTLDPRNTFIVYHNGLGNKPVMGVRFVTRSTGEIVYSVYTTKRYYEFIAQSTAISVSNGEPQVIGGLVRIKAEDHIYGNVPIIEYPANAARLGEFEIVIPLLDALNAVSSNRLDGIEQFIQSLLVLIGTDIEDEQFKAIRALGGIKLPQGGEAKYLTQELNQQQTQTFVNYLYQTVLVICGMPNRNGGSSTSDTGSAVIMRDGWSDAEARAKDSELMFKLSEKQFLRLVLEYTRTLREMDLKLSSVEIRFTRRNYENIQAKAQVLTTMLNNDKIDPKLAFESCGMFVDPDLAYTQSVEYARNRALEIESELDADARVQTEAVRG